MLRRIGAEAREVRSAEQLRALDGLIIPGGESTTLGRLIEDFHLLEPLRVFARSEIPTWGTCAGLIALARHASDLPFPTLEAIDIEADRNAYNSCPSLRAAANDKAWIPLLRLMREPDQITLSRSIVEIVVVAALVVLPRILWGTPTLRFVVGLLWVFAIIHAVV